VGPYGATGLQPAGRLSGGCRDPIVAIIRTMGLSARDLARTASAPWLVRRPLVRQPWQRVDPFVAATVAMALMLLVITAGLAFHPRLSFVVPDLGLDLVLNTLALGMAGVVAGISWARFLETNRGATVLQASAFLILTLAGALFVIGPLAGWDRALGQSIHAPGQLPVYAGIIARLAVAALLLAAAVAQIRDWSPSAGTARLLLLVPAGAFAALVVVLASAQSRLPAVLDVRMLEDLTAGVAVVLPGGVIVGQLVGLLAGLAFLVAALLFFRHYRLSGARASGFLGLGLVVALFAQLNFVLYPALHPGMVTIEDFLLVGFAVVLLIGHVAQEHADLAALRETNITLARYRDAEVRRARVEERARLARDLHDGLAQKLWRARLLQGRLAELPELEDRARALCRQSESALAAAILEAREALDAMRQVGGDGSLRGSLEAELDEFGRRSGVRTELVGSGRFTELPIRLRPEVQGILREALVNAERHADATMVRVRLERRDRCLEMEIRDNGRGFEPDRRRPDRYGLLGMRERAELLDARLTIASAPQAGTTIRLAIPIDPAWPS
jgi:signal transduction histidine kinase